MEAGSVQTKEEDETKQSALVVFVIALFSVCAVRGGLAGLRDDFLNQAITAISDGTKQSFAMTGAFELVLQATRAHPQTAVLIRLFISPVHRSSPCQRRVHQAKPVSSKLGQEF